MKNCNLLQDMEETGQPRAKWHPGLDVKQKEDIRGKSGEIRIKIYSLVNSSIPMLIS